MHKLLMYEKISAWYLFHVHFLKKHKKLVFFKTTHFSENKKTKADSKSLKTILLKNDCKCKRWVILFSNADSKKYSGKLFLKIATKRVHLNDSPTNLPNAKYNGGVINSYSLSTMFQGAKTSKQPVERRQILGLGFKQHKLAVYS